MIYDDDINDVNGNDVNSDKDTYIDWVIRLYSL